MGKAAWYTLGISTSIQLVGAVLCAVWPLVGLVGKDDFWELLWDHYSVLGSNLDVLALCVVVSAILPALLGVILMDRPIPPFNIIAYCIWAVVTLGQGLLVVKSLVVAVLGSDAIWPAEEETYTTVGVVWMYLPIITSLLTLAVQNAAAQNITSGLKAKWQAGSRDAEQQPGGATDEIREPLLGKEDGGTAQEGSEKDRRRGTIMFLARMATADLHILLLAFTAGGLAALGQALIPYYTGILIDQATLDPDRRAFQATVLKLMAVSLACALFTGMRGGLFTLAMARLNIRFRQRLFASLLSQDMAFFDTTKTGDITSRLAADTTTVSDQITLNLNVAMRSLAQAALVMVFMVKASWRLTVVSLIIIPFELVISKIYGAIWRELSKRIQTELAEANSVAEEVVSSMPTVRAHAAEASSRALYARSLAKFMVLQKKSAWAYTSYQVLATFVPNLVAAVVLWFGGELVLQQRMSGGALVSFMLYQRSLSDTFQMMGDIFSALAAAVGAADKVVSLIQREPGIPAPGRLQPPEFAGRIQLDSVVFSYPARPHVSVLNGLSLTINPGEVVALVGPSGGGKSSVVKLLERYYLPQAGQVLLDGREVGVYDPAWLRRHVALVSQEPTLYARSIKSNICFGLEEEDGVPPDQVPTMAEVQAAACLANAHDFIMSMPNGYDTTCGDRGVQLSGGQKQRLAIARALIRKPRILLLDEATSALDADSEAAVQEALDRIMHQQTVLVIAHRLSTVQDADRIIVLSKGVAVEEGTHKQLLEEGGVYQALVRRQMDRRASSASLASMRRNESDASFR